MSRLNQIEGAVVLALGLSACSDGINDRPPVIAKDPTTVDAIEGAAHVSNPADYLQVSLGLTPNELIERVKSWIPQGSIPTDAQNIRYILENREYGGMGVLMESGADGFLEEVHEHTPAQIDKATFVVVKYDIPGKNGVESKETVFALECSNGLVRELSDATVTATSELIRTRESIPPVTQGVSSSRTITIPAGGSLMGTLGVTQDNSAEIARRNGLSNYYAGARYVVIVHPGDTFSQDAKGVWSKQ